MEIRSGLRLRLRAAFTACVPTTHTYPPHTTSTNSWLTAPNPAPFRMTFSHRLFFADSEYCTKEKLELKLSNAIQHSSGFGMM